MSIIELVNGLGAGYADDQAFQVGECYSGGRCYGPGPGTDQTPEYIAQSNDPIWSTMSVDPETYGAYRISFSIEELATTDFNDIPSVDD
jgi:hypothetical protein